MLLVAVNCLISDMIFLLFAAGTEEASTMVCERLYSAQNQVQELRQRSLRAEEQLREVEAAAIEMASQPLDISPSDQGDASATKDTPEEKTVPDPEKKDVQPESETPARRVTVFTNRQGLGEMKPDQVHNTGFRRHRLGDDF